MTAYFDEYSSQLSNGPNSVDDIIAIEQCMIGHAVLVCGDREFPEDLREKIMSIIAVEGVYPFKYHSYDSRHEEGMEGLVNKKAKKHAELTHSSKLLSELHEAFHEVGTRRIETRFGLLTNDPLDIIRTREKWEMKEYGTGTE